MPISRRGGMILLSTLATAAVLAPVRPTTAEALAPATAECTTCCARPGVLCVVCSRTCITVPDAYDNGGGPCPDAGTPNIS